MGALFCFALLCGLAASSIQSETETDLTKEGEAAGDEVLVEQPVQSRAARGADKKNKIKMLREKCNENPKGNACKTERRLSRRLSRKAKKSEGRNRKNKNKNKKRAKEEIGRQKEVRGRKGG